MVFLGPYEHHSNELPWRESIADVVVIDEDADGHIDLDQLRERLIALRRTARCSSAASRAASNVTGVLSDADRDRGAAARARRPVVLGLRRGRTLRADPDARKRTRAR